MIPRHPVVGFVTETNKTTDPVATSFALEALAAGATQTAWIPANPALVTKPILLLTCGDSFNFATQAQCR